MTTTEHLIVHNGDRIRATAQFVISPNGATTLHGQTAVPLTDPIACSDHLKVPVHGLIPSKLVNSGTPAQLAPARAAIEALMRNTENGISMIGGGTGHDQIHVRLLILTDQIYRRLESIGFDLLNLRPTITPA